MDLSVVPFNKQSNNHYKADNESEDGDVVEPKLSKNGNKKERSLSGKSDVAAVRYRECMRNHAATIGGHANDGCGEFLLNSASAAAADGSSLTCAACGCHRNFHRRETAVPYHHHGHGHPPLLMYNSAAAAGPTTPRWEHHHHHHHQHQRMAAAQQREAGSYERRSSETPEREDVATANNMGTGAVTSGGSSGKRFRTKFTQEQKDRMQAFADSIGWRIQRHDDAAINQFCADIGVKRNVLKVWMHNNKNAHRRSRDPDDPPPGMSSASQIPTSNPPPPPPPPQAVVGV